LADTDVSVTLQQVVQLTNLSVVTINKMVNGGYLEKDGPGTFRLVKISPAHARWTKDHPGPGGSKSDSTKEASAQRVQDARAKQIEQATALEAKELIPISDHLALYDMLMGGLKAELSGMPAQLTRDRTLRVEYETKFNDMMRRVSERWKKKALSIEEGTDADEDDT